MINGVWVFRCYWSNENFKPVNDLKKHFKETTNFLNSLTQCNDDIEI